MHLFQNGRDGLIEQDYKKNMLASICSPVSSPTKLLILLSFFLFLSISLFLSSFHLLFTPFPHSQHRAKGLIRDSSWLCKVCRYLDK